LELNSSITAGIQRLQTWEGEHESVLISEIGLDGRILKGIMSTDLLRPKSGFKKLPATSCIRNILAKKQIIKSHLFTNPATIYANYIYESSTMIRSKKESIWNLKLQINYCVHPPSRTYETT
jgi:hypothetical protein